METVLPKFITMDSPIEFPTYKNKRIIEIKRGDDVPLNAKWLDSFKHISYEDLTSVMYDMYDVFEVAE